MTKEDPIAELKEHLLFLQRCGFEWLGAGDAKTEKQAPEEIQDVWKSVDVPLKRPKRTRPVTPLESAAPREMEEPQGTEEISTTSEQINTGGPKDEKEKENKAEPTRQTEPESEVALEELRIVSPEIEEQRDPDYDESGKGEETSENEEEDDPQQLDLFGSI
jgi:hypothetical protein